MKDHGAYRNQRGLKLHLGCGMVRLDGYVNIDRDPGALADLRLSVLDLAKEFLPGSVSEILSVHALNYLSLWEARDFFRLAAELLQPGGRLIMETANLMKCIERLQRGVGNFPEYLEGIRAIHGFGLDQYEAREPYTPNSFSWSPWHLEYELAHAGFQGIQILPPQTHLPWRDMRVEARVPNSEGSSVAAPVPAAI